VSFTAVVMAAGQGTRMRSRVPKVLHPICGRPMVLWPVRAALEAGAAAVVVVQGADAALADALDGEDVVLAVQPKPDGTGGAVAAAAEHVDPELPVVVLSGDVPLVTADAIAALVRTHAERGAGATMATTILDDPSGYGRVVRGPDGHVEDVVETKVAGDARPEHLAIREVNTGIFCFDGAALLDALPRLTTDNAQGERYLPRVLPLIRERGGEVHAHIVDDAGLVLGINDRTQLAEVTAIAQRRIIEGHQRTGVTFAAPVTCTVDVDVAIGQDSLVEPGSHLRGATAVGGACTIGPNTTLIDTTTGDGCTVLQSHAVGAVLHERVSVGPFAYLRPGTVLRDASKVGTYVEVKNSVIGAGTKVPHLSYIGDADVGERTNLGAATITANYDGRNKHRTTIGSDVKSAVDVTFVAPVSVGDGSYTGAGSIITEDVPDGALGIARARQTNIGGYAARRAEAQESR
jgi:bifunctional UDP-N-acetylglucosamine pyrophosphorylase/glucosamine-1-phosphate N-acetyltransferase